MLGIEDFGKQLENDLNVIASTITGAIPFKIFTNLGDYTEAYRYDNAGNTNAVAQYQYGILRVLPSEIVPVKGLAIQNFIFQLECAVNIDASEKDDNGNYLQVVYTQEILNNYAQSYTGTTTTIEGIDGKSYTIAYAINPCTVSSVTMTTSDYGEVLPIQITIEVGAVENGVNLNDIDVFIDGEAVYPLSIQATRKRIPNENSFSDKTSTSVGILQNGFGLDMIVPALYNNLGETILDDIYMGKDNVAHCVDLKFNRWITYYTYTAGILFVKENMTKHFAMYSYDEDKNELSFDVTIGTDKSIMILADGSIDFGDETTSSGYTHTYTTAGTYKIKITATTSDVRDGIQKKDYCYIMTFGNTNHNTSANNTITPSISLVEGVQHILDYNSSNWKEVTQTFTQTTSSALYTLLGESPQNNDIVFISNGDYFIIKTYPISVGLEYYYTFSEGTYTIRRYRP